MFRGQSEFAVLLVEVLDAPGMAELEPITLLEEHTLQDLVGQGPNDLGSDATTIPDPLRNDFACPIIATPEP